MKNTEKSNNNLIQKIEKYEKTLFEFSLLANIKMYLGEVLIVLGAGIFSYNVFNFSWKDEVGFDIGFDIDFGSRSLGNVAYYYSGGTLLLIALGAMLIASGILIIKNKSK